MVKADLGSKVTNDAAGERYCGMFGFLNVRKPLGMTSHDVIYKIRKASGIKQVGHTGTLDPFAEGVLPVCIGKATRLIEYLDDDKEYLAVVKFGIETDTYDLDGNIISVSDKKITKSDLGQILPEFRGEVMQTPPMFSAIKVKGKKLYEYARKGQQIEVEARKVFIEKLELKNFDKENQEAEFLVKCSKGTYIRSIAHDIGQKLSVGGHLVKLTRTKAGKFNIETSVDLENFQNFSDVKKYLINPIDMLDYEKIKVDAAEYEKILHGNPIHNKNDISTGQVVILIYNDIIIAVGVADGDKILIKKVF